MLKLKNALFVILIVMLFSSCGMNTALTANLNNKVTNVTLSQKNL
jgi:PBP1b-binding outer membrane lipoprotein LpoB